MEDMVERSSPAGEVEEFSSPIEDNIEPSSPAGESQDCPSPSHEIKAASEAQDCPSPSHEIKAARETQDCPSPSHEIKAADIPSLAGEIEVEDKMDISFFPNPARETEARKQLGGWKTMPYILGSIALERLASIALTTNLLIFLIIEMHMEPASAVNLIYFWSGAINLARSIGGLLSESIIGSRFRTITYASLASLMGMVITTLIPALPSLHPPSCTFLTVVDQCMGPTAFQLSILIGALGLLTIGTGGTRSCILSFGVDQFDQPTEKRRCGGYTNTCGSYFDWHFTTCALVMVIAYTVLLFIQNKMGWVLGFAIPATLMLGSCILFLAGTGTYVFVRPDGNFFTDIAQVLVASYKKRRLQLPAKHEIKDKLYDPQTGRRSIVTKLPLTNQLSFLNKAAIVSSGDTNPNGSRRNPWRLASIQQVEEVKCVFKVAPVLVSGVLFSAVVSQQDAFISSQMLKMDRQLGPNFKIPLGSLGVIPMVTVMVFVPFCSRVLVPTLRKMTKVESGVSNLQRMGIGMVFAFLSVVVAGVVERMRRESASARPDGMAPISVLWVAPQFILIGLAEGFSVIGQMGFYYNELPQNMRTVASSLICFTTTGSSYISSLLVYVIRKHTHPNWLASNVNQGRLDLYYYAIATIGVLNLFYFLIVSRNYEYKVTDSEMGDEESEEHVKV